MKRDTSPSFVAVSVRVRDDVGGVLNRNTKRPITRFTGGTAERLRLDTGASKREAKLCQFVVVESLELRGIALRQKPFVWEELPATEQTTMGRLIW